MLRWHAHSNAIQPGGNDHLASQSATYRKSPGIFQHVDFVLVRLGQLLQPGLLDPAMTGTTGAATPTLRNDAWHTVIQCSVHQRLTAADLHVLLGTICKNERDAELLITQLNTSLNNRIALFAPNALTRAHVSAIARNSHNAPDEAKMSGCIIHCFIWGHMWSSA